MRWGGGRQQNCARRQGRHRIRPLGSRRPRLKQCLVRGERHLDGGAYERRTEQETEALFASHGFAVVTRAQDRVVLRLGMVREAQAAPRLP